MREKCVFRGAAMLLLFAAVFGGVALASRPAQAEELNVYTIWSERYATAIFDQFTRDTGVRINFLRFPSGEVLARLIAEKGNPQADVFFGGIADAFVAGKAEGIFEQYVPGGADMIPSAYKDRRATGPAWR